MPNERFWNRSPCSTIVQAVWPALAGFDLWPHGWANDQPMKGQPREASCRLGRLAWGQKPVQTFGAKLWPLPLVPLVTCLHAPSVHVSSSTDIPPPPGWPPPKHRHDGRWWEGGGGRCSAACLQHSFQALAEAVQEERGGVWVFVCG